jgi:tetratricopeptide repeat protein 8
LRKNSKNKENYLFPGVLEMRRGNVESARAFFATAAKIGPHMFEPAFNTAHLADKTGDLQTAYVVVQKALKNFPEHSDSNDLLKQLQKHFSVL